MMENFITFKDNNDKGEETYYILQKNYPHWLGFISQMPTANTLCQMPVTGHHLYITFFGTLRGANIIPGYKDVQKEINEVFFDMSQWFYLNRILKEPKRYKKWAIPI